MFNDLIGLPYADLGRTRAGVDCWGLVYLDYAALGIALPSYAGLYLGHEEREEIAAVVAGGIANEAWSKVEGEPRPHDVVVFRRGGMDMHVGIIVEPGKMLHVDTTAPSRIESYDAPRWRPRLTGIYRHKDLS